MMKYLSVCSGIEAATVAWKPLEWKAAGFAEIDKFPSAVLSHHYPDVQNFGDFTTIQADDVGSIDILVGGTPCQSFSVAGLRGGLADDRGNLALEFLRLAQRTRPRWLVWENVPGVLSSNGGRDFGSILGGMVELGYGVFRRVLDAQYFGLAQRRKRVFVVGYLGDWRPAAAVLLEREGLSWNSPPRRETRKDVAPDVSTRIKGSSEHMMDVVGALNTANGKTRPGDTVQCAMAGHMLAFGGNNTSGPIDVATTVQAHGGPHGRQDFGSETFVAFSCKDHGADAGEIAPTLRAMGHDGSHANAGGQLAVAFRTTGNDGAYDLGDQSGCLGTNTDPSAQVLLERSSVRRLTPRECERLQGFPDDHTLISYRGKPASECPDGPRYKAIGNSMAVPVMAWLGRNIQKVESIIQ